MAVLKIGKALQEQFPDTVDMCINWLLREYPCKVSASMTDIYGRTLVWFEGGGLPPGDKEICMKIEDIVPGVCIINLK